MNGLNDFFCSIDWDNLFDGKETDNCWSTFTETVEAGTAQFIPKIPRRTEGKPPWMTRNVIRMCRKKQRYWKAYTSSKTPEHFERYKQQEKTTKKAVSSAKRRYEKRIANNGNKNGWPIQGLWVDKLLNTCNSSTATLTCLSGGTRHAQTNTNTKHKNTLR